MDEIKNALKVADAALKTVRVIDVFKKTVVAGTVLTCGIFAVRFFINQKGR